MFKNWIFTAIAAYGFVFVATVSGQEIHMKTRTFSPVPGATVVNGSARAHQIVAFDHPVGVNDLDALNMAGVQVTGILPDNAVVVSGAMRSRPVGAIWIGGVDSRDKVSPAITSNNMLNNAAGSQVSAIIEFHADVDADAQSALETSMGLVFNRPAGLLAKHAIVQADAATIAKLSSQDEVAYIFPADPTLLTGAYMYPCAGMLTSAGPVAQYSNIMHGWSIEADNMVHLSYYFASVTAKVPAATVQSEVLRAFAQWAARLNITFTPAGSANLARSISIQFASGAHGDSYPFDGPGGMLGHTFYPAPINSEPIAGNMHFDADEAWKAGGDTDIYTVALHEIGHALGLGHSDNPGDVMYPYYQRGRALSTNDIGAALQLYPAAGATSPTVAPPSVPTTPVTVTTTTPTAPAPAPTQPTVTALSLMINPTASTTKLAVVELAGTLTGGKGNGTVQWQTDRGYTGKTTLMASGAWTSADIPLVTGDNTITVMAFDAADHVTTRSVIVTLQQPGSTVTAPITISTSAPVLPVVTVKTSTISVSGKASGGAGVTSVTWQTSNGATGTACGTDTWIAAGIPVPQGNTTVVIRAYDSRGASAWVAVVAVHP